MKWHKLGRIFDPGQHALPAGCREFAVGHHSLSRMVDDYVRVYEEVLGRPAGGGGAGLGSGQAAAR